MQYSIPGGVHPKHMPQLHVHVAVHTPIRSRQRPLPKCVGSALHTTKQLQTESQMPPTYQLNVCRSYCCCHCLCSPQPSSSNCGFHPSLTCPPCKGHFVGIDDIPTSTAAVAVLSCLQGVSRPGRQQVVLDGPHYPRPQHITCC
jgi:hypothetical protein